MSTRQRRDVQGLRALAIFSVLLFHFYPRYFPNGFLGVDVFFVISGYLIFTIFSRNVKKNGLNWETISDFYYKRLARIVPLSLVYTSCAVIAYSYMAPPMIVKQSQISAYKALLFLTNIFAVIERNDYFERLLDENLFTHTWSLAVEVQYYLLFPILFLIHVKFCGKSRLFYPFVLIGSFTAFLLSPPQFSFNMMPTRLWQFLFITLFSDRVQDQNDEGMEDGKVLLAEPEEKFVGLSQTAHEIVAETESAEKDMQARRTSKDPQYVHIIYFISFALLSLPFLPIVLPSIITRVIVSTSSSLVIVYGNKINNPLLTNRLSVFIGDISYSLYLFHWPFSVYLSGDFSSINLYWGIPVSLAAATVIHQIFEKRYRTWSKKVLLIFTLLLFIISTFLIIYSPQLNKAMQKRTTITKEAAIKDNERMFAHLKEHVTVKQCNYKQWRNATIEPPFGLCIMPKGQGKLKFMLIGNSYSINQASGLYEAFKPYFSEFSIFSMMWFFKRVVCKGTESQKAYEERADMYCKHPADYKDVIPDFLPDVIFIIQRYGAPTGPLPPPGKEDKAYKEMVQRFSLILNMSSLFFVEDSIPSAGDMRSANAMIRNGKEAEYINKIALRHGEDPPARARTKKLMEYCGSKCRLFDIEPAIVDKKGQVMAIDEETWLAIYDQDSHFTSYGKKKIDPVFSQLARKYGGELKKLEQMLYRSQR